MSAKGPHKKASDYLRVAHLYRLGVLPTEQPHPGTRRLSEWARLDLPRAISALHAIDCDALERLERAGTGIDELAAAVRATLEKGRRVFLCGCGATGRLSLSLEFLWRERFPRSDRVQAFMAGGDVALVHALEGFEDHADFGARHLEQMGFADGDLLIASTEGGETPYVIGATRCAAGISSNAPYFLYCNPTAILARHVERFRSVHEDPNVRTLCLDVGPMALSGSTRMQASTVLQLAVGLALLHPDEPAAEAIGGYRRRLRELDPSFLAAFIEREAGIYAAGDHVTYRVRDYGITVLTDTTERAPTFSLVSFDQLDGRRDRYSLCYVSLEDASTADEGWLRLLNRAPRPLGWTDVDGRTDAGYLARFDFSAESARRRRSQIPGREHHEFTIRGSGRGIELGLDGLSHELDLAGMPPLQRHLLLKQLLNIHSTLVMGRLGRYQGNLMTWVSPTNGKLVDRAARYVLQMLVGAGQTDTGYEEVVRRLFAEMEATGPGESIVLKACRSLLNRRVAS